MKWKHHLLQKALANASRLSVPLLPCSPHRSHTAHYYLLPSTTITYNYFVCLFSFFTTSLWTSEKQWDHFIIFQWPFSTVRPLHQLFLWSGTFFPQPCTWFTSFKSLLKKCESDPSIPGHFQAWPMSMLSYRQLGSNPSWDSSILFSPSWPIVSSM